MARRRQELDSPEAMALNHPDPWIRRQCLAYLDHNANDHSVAVFLAALDDPVAPVREMALHGLACETCRDDDLRVEDVAPRIIDAFENDTSADVRVKLLGILLRLANRSEDALATIRRAAESDFDPLVREAAHEAMSGQLVRNPEDLRRRARSRKGKALRRTQEG